MPVHKYRSIADMPDTWVAPGDPSIGRRMRRLWQMASAFAGPLGIPRGVQKFHSLEEMAEDRHRYEEERIARIAARNARKQ